MDLDNIGRTGLLAITGSLTIAPGSTVCCETIGWLNWSWAWPVIDWWRALVSPLRRLNERKNENLISKNIVTGVRVFSGVRVDKDGLLFESWFAK